MIKLYIILDRKSQMLPVLDKVSLSYLLALHSIDGLGPIRLKKILDYFQDPQEAWLAAPALYLNLGIPRSVVEKLERRRKTLDPLNYLEGILMNKIKVVTIFEDSYPKRLRNIYDPPVVIYYKGDLSKADDLAIGVVGSRKMTSYGRAVTEKFTSELAQLGLTIVSGLARGVDTIAHQSTLQSGGRTLAVLGGGINKIFPLENTGLAQRIAAGSGAVLSEFPPDSPHIAGNFPARNRIIAGLTMGVLVTEAAEDSGSLITARLALEEGRSVFAVPGPVTSSLSKGPADLIKEGAKLTFSVEDILEELGIDRHRRQVQQAASFQPNLSEEAVLKILEQGGKHIDEICRELKKSAAEISAALIKMEIAGLVKSLGGGNYIKSF